MIAANNGALVVLDNLSNLPEWLSDAICILATFQFAVPLVVYFAYPETSGKPLEEIAIDDPETAR